MYVKYGTILKVPLKNNIYDIFYFNLEVETFITIQKLPYVYNTNFKLSKHKNRYRRKLNTAYITFK